MRWLRIAISFTVTLLTLLCMLPAQAAQGSGWAVLLDDQGALQLSDIRSTRYTNQFSPIELDRITAANPGGALWLRFQLNPGKHEQLLRIFAPDLSQLDLYVLDGDTLVEQSHNGSDQPLSARPLPSTDLMVPLPQREQPRRAHRPDRVRAGRADADGEQVHHADRGGAVDARFGHVNNPWKYAGWRSGGRGWKWRLAGTASVSPDIPSGWRYSPARR